MNRQLFALLLSIFIAQASWAQGTVTLNSEEQNFIQIINRFRSSLGLPNLKVNAQLQEAAEIHSEWMYQTGLTVHQQNSLRLFSSSKRMKAAGYEYTVAGENVASGSCTAIDTFYQWAYSPGHLAVMVNPHYREIGISRVGDSNSGKCNFFWTGDFGSQEDPSFDPDPIEDEDKIMQAIRAIVGEKQ